MRTRFRDSTGVVTGFFAFRVSIDAGFAGLEFRVSVDPGLSCLGVRASMLGTLVHVRHTVLACAHWVYGLVLRCFDLATPVVNTRVVQCYSNASVIRYGSKVICAAPLDLAIPT